MKRIFSIENLTAIGIVLGIIFGVYFPGFSLEIRFLGDIFLNLLKMIIVPLIFCSVYVAVVGLQNFSSLKKLGIKTFLYYIVTTSLAVVTGLVLVNIIQPGRGEHIFHNVKAHVKAITLKDIFFSLIPSNPVKSMAEGRVLQIIVFAILIGLSTLKLEEEKRKLLFSFFDSFNESILILTRWIVFLTPIGVFSIVASIVAKEGVSSIFTLWKYALTVVCGLGIHATVTLPLLLLVAARCSPFKYVSRVRKALLVALSTASSSATLPITLEVAQENAGVSKEVAGFVLPLGSTVNMDGTALYESVAAVFIANIYGLHLSLGHMVIIFLTATLASIGAAGIPSAGLVTMGIVLKAVGMPLEGIGLILAVDRFLDMLRTSVNVWGDLVGARVIQEFFERRCDSFL